MRRDAHQDPSLAARLEDEVELSVLEVAQSAVHEPRRAAAGATGEVLLLDERHVQPAHRRIPRDAGARHAATDDQHVEVIALQHIERTCARPRIETGAYDHATSIMASPLRA